MGFRKEVRQGLKELNRFIAGHNSAVPVLEKRIASLESQNQELLNRVMAVDYRKFQIYSEAAQGGGIKDLSEIPFDADENIIGEAVEVPGSAPDMGSNS